MIIMPIIIPVNSSGDSGPFISGKKNLVERGILAAILFVTGFIAMAMVFYTGAVLDNLSSRYFADEPSRLLSTFLPQGDLLMGLGATLAPLFTGMIVALIVASSEKAYARILGWVTVIAMLTVIVMGFIPV